MSADLGRQAAALLLAALLGAAAGLLYDLLRPPRRAMKRALAAGIDLLYALAVGAGLFAFAMSVGDGRLGLWTLASALLGFLLWLHRLSPVLLPLFVRAAAGLSGGMEKLGNAAKNLRKRQKSSFNPGETAIL